MKMDKQMSLFDELDNPITPVIREKKIHLNSKYGSNSGELLSGYEHLATKIGKFMYEGRPGRSKKKEYTLEECTKFLEEIRQTAWNHHNKNKDKLRKS